MAALNDDGWIDSDFREDGPKPRQPALDRACQTCRHWSPWMPRTGDCLRYAKARQDALLAADDLVAWRRDWPRLAAIDTGADDTCEHWEGRVP